MKISWLILLRYLVYFHNKSVDSALIYTWLYIQCFQVKLMTIHLESMCNLFQWLSMESIKSRERSECSGGVRRRRNWEPWERNWECSLLVFLSKLIIYASSSCGKLFIASSIPDAYVAHAYPPPSLLLASLFSFSSVVLQMCIDGDFICISHSRYAKWEAIRKDHGNVMMS